MAHIETDELGNRFYVTKNYRRNITGNYVLGDRDKVTHDITYEQTKSLTDLLGCHPLQAVKDALINVLGKDPQEVEDNVVDKPPLLNSLTSDWYQDRDVEKLYSHKDYIYDTVHCAFHNTIHFNRFGSVDTACIMDRVLRQIHFCGDWNKNIQILDMGPGIGIQTLVMAQHLPHAQIVICEKNVESLAVFNHLYKKSGLQNITVINSLDEIKDRHFDYIVCLEFIEHIPSATEWGVGHPSIIIDALTPLSKKGGKLFYSSMWSSEWRGNLTLGHFKTYQYDEGKLTFPDDTKRPIGFNKMMKNDMRNRGWEKDERADWIGAGQRVNYYIRQY